MDKLWGSSVFVRRPLIIQVQLDWFLKCQEYKNKGSPVFLKGLIWRYYILDFINQIDVTKYEWCKSTEEFDNSDWSKSDSLDLVPLGFDWISISFITDKFCFNFIPKFIETIKNFEFIKLNINLFDFWNCPSGSQVSSPTWKTADKY